MVSERNQTQKLHDHIHTEVWNSMHAWVQARMGIEENRGKNDNGSENLHNDRHMPKLIKLCSIIRTCSWGDNCTLLKLFKIKEEHNKPHTNKLIHMSFTCIGYIGVIFEDNFENVTNECSSSRKEHRGKLPCISALQKIINTEPSPPWRWT